MNRKIKIRTKICIIIAFWLFIISLPGIIKMSVELYSILRQGLMLNLTQEMMINWSLNLYAFAVAIGLLAAQQWARKGAVLYFIGHSIWSFYAVFSLMGPTLDHIVEISSGQYGIPLNIGSAIILVFCLIYIIWPVSVTLYLTNPKIKSNFIPKVLPERP